MALSTPSPSASPRKETEAERIRLRKIELYNLLEELEKDNKECNEDIGRYGQKLFYCIRDIEKEFKRTEAPLSLESLRAYGVDIQSMVAKTDKKKKKFNPSWLNATGQSPKKKEKASTVQFSRKAEYAFRSDKNNNDADHEEYKIKDLLKTARSILNKITPATKDEFIEEFLALHVAGEPPEFNAPEGQLAQVMDIVFAKATSEPLYCPLYAELCKRQFDADIRLAGRSPFASAAVEKLQKTLQNKSVDIGKNTIDKETNVEKKENTILQNHEEFRKYKLGSINFVEQLYNKYVVRTILIRWCLFSLLRHTHPDAEGNFPEPPYDEEFIFCATRLIEAVGRKFTNCTDFDGAAEYLDQTINHLLKIAPNCSPKIRFKILDMKELSDNNWEQRKIIVSGIPKSIDEIHKETEPSGTLRAWRRFSIPKNRDSVPRPPRNDVLETFVNLRKRYSHAAGCGKYCTTSCPRILKIQELVKNHTFWSKVEELYPSIAAQINEDIRNLITYI